MTQQQVAPPPLSVAAALAEVMHQLFSIPPLLSLIEEYVGPTVTRVCGGTEGFADGSAPLMREPQGIAYDRSNDSLIIADTFNSAIRVWSIKELSMSTLCGAPHKEGFRDGPCGDARLNLPRGLAVDPTDGAVLVADTDHHRHGLRE